MLCEGIEQEKGQELMYDPIKCPERLAIYTSLSLSPYYRSNCVFSGRVVLAGTLPPDFAPSENSACLEVVPS